MRLAAAVADGLILADDRTRQLGQGRYRSDTDEQEPLTELVADLSAHEGHRYGLELVGLRIRLRERITSHAYDWVTLLPWLLQGMGQSPTLTLGTVWAINAGAEPLPAIRDIAESGIEPAATRALGLLDLLHGEHDTTALLARLALELDHGRAPVPAAVG